VLLTRAPLYRGRSPFSCDLHVLGAPLTFVLSQDQTLQLKTEEPMNPPQRKRIRLEFLLIVEPDFAFAGLDAAARLVGSGALYLGRLTHRRGVSRGADNQPSFESVRFSFQGPSGERIPQKREANLREFAPLRQPQSLFFSLGKPSCCAAVPSSEGGRAYCLRTEWSRSWTVKSG
jgi:hypothetical protein